MPTSGNILALLPVLTPYTATSAQFDLLYPYALDEFEGGRSGDAVRPAPNGRSPTSWPTISPAGEDQTRVQPARRSTTYSYTGRRAGNDLVPLVPVHDPGQQLDRCRDALAIGPAALAGVQHADVSGAF